MHQWLQWLDFAALDHPLEVIGWRILVPEKEPEPRALCNICINLTGLCYQWWKQGMQMVDVSRLSISALAQNPQLGDGPYLH